MLLQPRQVHAQKIQLLSRQARGDPAESVREVSESLSLQQWSQLCLGLIY